MLKQKFAVGSGGHCLQQFHLFLSRGEKGLVQDEDADHAGDFVADTHQADAPGRRLDGPEDGGVRVGGSLKDGKPQSLHEQADKEETELSGHRRGHEDDGADGHRHQAQNHTVAVAHFFDERGRGDRHHEIGDVEGEGHERGLEVSKFACGSEKRDEDVVEPCHEAEHEEQRPDDEKTEGVFVFFHTVIFERAKVRFFCGTLKIYLCFCRVIPVRRYIGERLLRRSLRK